MSPKTTSRGMRIRHLMAIIAVAAFGIWMATRVGIIIDAVAHGPYCTWYNNQCLRLSSGPVWSGAQSDINPYSARRPPYGSTMSRAAVPGLTTTPRRRPLRASSRFTVVEGLSSDWSSSMIDV